MSYKGKTYSRKGPGGKSGNPFDRMMKEQCNKPVAAKSAGIVGKWGVTSFKSVRASSDTSSSSSAPPTQKVKKFFKSRTENPAAVESAAGVVGVATVASAKIINIPEKTSSKKFFRSKNKELITSEEIPPDPSPSRSTRSRGAGGGEVSRSPLQSKEWSPGDLLPPTDQAEVKKTVTRTRRNRQNHSVPEENPVDKESRLLALFNSQSKENQPSDKPRKSKATRSQESQKRKIEEPDDDLLPPIKLKLSLSKSTFSDSDKYQVVRHSDLNVNTAPADSKDISNGLNKVRKESGESFQAWEENIIEKSDLELLDGDFSSINKDLTSQTALPPAKPTTKKLPRNTQPPPLPSVSEEADPFEMLLS